MVTFSLQYDARNSSLHPAEPFRGRQASVTVRHCQTLLPKRWLPPALAFKI